MDAKEEKFRSTPKDHKKYEKRLREYVELLFYSGKILEAKHFFKKYCRNYDHPKSISLGYKLAIATFDHADVEKFDQKLHESKADVQEIRLLQLKYYISVNNKACCENTCYELLEKQVTEECLHTIFEAISSQNSYKIVIYLFKNHKFNEKKLNKNGEKLIKSILMSHLVETITKSSHV